MPAVAVAIHAKMPSGRGAPYGDADERRRLALAKVVRDALPDVDVAPLLRDIPREAGQLVALKTALQAACRRTPDAVRYLVARGEQISGAQQVTEAERVCNVAMHEERRLAKERFEAATVVREEVLLLRCPCSPEAVPHSKFQRGEENKKGAKAAVSTFKRCQACGMETLV